MNRGEYCKYLTSLSIICLMAASSFGSNFVSAGDSTSEEMGHILIDFRHGECNGKVIDDYELPYSIPELLRYYGYAVDENYDKWLDEIDLIVYDALLIVSPWGWGPDLKGFYEVELNAITNYVQDGGGLLLTVDTQMYYENEVPNQVAGLFGVKFFGDFFSDEYIVNYEHPITIDMKQGDLFNPFLLFDAAIEIYPPEAVVLVDVVDRGVISNSSMVWTLRASVSTVSPAMIALEYGNGRAVFGPMNGLTQPWGTAYYDRDEPNKMLLNSVEWLAGGIKSRILRKEDELYKTAKSSINTITRDMGYIIRDLASDLTGQAINLGLKKYGTLAKDMIWESDEEMEDVIAFAKKFTRLQTADFEEWVGEMAATFLTPDGVPFQEAIDQKHDEFREGLSEVEPNPNADIAEIKGSIHGVKVIVDYMPSFIQDFKATYEAVEEWQSRGSYTQWILIGGAAFLIMAAGPTGGTTLPLAATALLTASRAITYINMGTDVGEFLYVCELNRNVYEKENKIVNIYARELDLVIHTLEVGELPKSSAELIEASSPEMAALGSTSTFGGRIANTGSFKEDARLAVEIRGPSGRKRGPFYSETKTIAEGGSEYFTIDVPFPPFKGYYMTGDYEVNIYAEYGILQLEWKTPSVVRGLKLSGPTYEFTKSIVLVPTSSTDVTVQISIRNLSGSANSITITDMMPKELAASVDDIEFETPPEIVEADPVFKWSLDLPVGASAELVYRMHTSLSPEEIEWLIPAATLQSSGPDLTSLIVIGEEEVMVKDIDMLLLQLKGIINGLGGSSFNGGDAAKEVLLERVEGVWALTQEGDLWGALRSFMDLFAPTAGGEPSIEYWITDEDARLTILPIFDDTESLMRLLMLVHEDESPPTTTITLSGTQGANGWYVTDVAVSLSAADNEGGYGVDKTEYSLDGGATWTDYSGPFTVGEGITTISYRSADVAGNVEETKQQVVKVDKTHPEARISFDRGTSKVIVSGMDNLDGDVSVESLSGSISKTGKETFVYELKDDAGNNMRITFERTALEDKGDDMLSSVRVLEIEYNDGDPITAVGNNYEAKFVLDKKTGELKHLTCKIYVLGVDIMSKYNGQKDETSITLKDGGKKEEKVTLRGLVVVELVTNSGNINYRLVAH